MMKQNVLILHQQAVACVDITPTGCRMKSVPRATRGGGLAVIFLTSLKSSSAVSKSSAFDYSSFELLELTFTLQYIHLHFSLLYRLPPSKTKQLSDALSFERFPDFLSYCNTLKGNMLVLRDFKSQCVYD